MTLVVGKRHTPPSLVAPSLLETTVHSLGALTWNVNVPLMSGWSKHANTRWASLLSKEGWRYERPSSGSWKRLNPVPSCMYFAVPVTCSTLFSSRWGRAIRPPSNAPDWSALPFSSMRSTAGPLDSTKVPAPGWRQVNSTVVSVANVSSPPGRSRWTSYRGSDRSAARDRASSRVRLFRVVMNLTLGRSDQQDSALPGRKEPPE